MADTHVYLFPTHRERVYEMERAVEREIGKIVKVSKINFFYLMENGEKHYFLTYQEYSTWCLGRDYILRGNKYHSGYGIADMKGNLNNK